MSSPWLRILRLNCTCTACTAITRATNAATTRPRLESRPWHADEAVSLICHVDTFLKPSHLTCVVLDIAVVHTEYNAEDNSRKSTIKR
jgi:hypothetical protein